MVGRHPTGVKLATASVPSKISPMTDKIVFPRLCRQARLFPAITLLLAALLAAMPAAAQQTAPAPATATGETAGLNAQDLNGLADRLQNPDERQKLVETPRALAAAGDSADGKAADRQSGVEGKGE